jgi:tRNA threonylcarbamoyladenosine modification (KEOPS) complex  Pcc1 subunit
MQAISVYLYPNKIDVFTNLPSEWATERYRRVYNRNVKIHRGVDNRIDLQVRNSDQKAQTINETTLVFNIVNPESQELILQKDCVEIDNSAGRVYIVLSAEDTANIETGFYQYSIVKETRTSGANYSVTSRTPLYIDSQYGSLATIEVGNNLVGEPVDSLVVTVFNLYDPFDQPKYYVSSIIDANPQISNPQSLHTFQFNMSDYTGDILIQGSLSNSANPQVWVDIETISINNRSIAYQNIEGKYNWFRIRHTPNSSLSSPGTLDSVLYR